MHLAAVLLLTTTAVTALVALAVAIDRYERCVRELQRQRRLLESAAERQDKLLRLLEEKQRDLWTLTFTGGVVQRWRDSGRKVAQG